MSGHLETPEGWTPEFPGQRPPFAPGNTLSVTHGIHSVARVDPIAHGFIAEITADPSLTYLQQPRFAGALWQWATAQAKVQLLTEWVDGMTMEEAAVSDRGQTSPLELLRKWIATTQTQAARLGLDPLSAARLGKDIAGARQADAAGELTRLRAQHEAAQHNPPTPPS